LWPILLLTKIVVNVVRRAAWKTPWLCGDVVMQSLVADGTPSAEAYNGS
jgi:hypothetical protein